jgi:hypothetical protein
VEERRNGIRRAAVAVALLCCVPALACELQPGQRLQGKDVAASFRTEPERVTVGQHFVVLLSACPAPQQLRLDAHMPEHRHGMNYKPSVKALAPGRYRSEGWLFHMPGRWEFIFELGGERLTHSVRIE